MDDRPTPTSVMLFADDTHPGRTTQATPTLHDVATGTEAKKMTLKMASDAKPTIGAVHQLGDTPFIDIINVKNGSL